MINPFKTLNTMYERSFSAQQKEHSHYALALHGRIFNYTPKLGEPYFLVTSSRQAKSPR